MEILKRFSNYYLTEKTTIKGLFFGLKEFINFKFVLSLLNCNVLNALGSTSVLQNFWRNLPFKKIKQTSQDLT